jgi:sugar phosphate isomerase/epimerase
VKIAFEAHPGFCVYNTETLLKLRRACGDQLGANLDPSHFFWQGIDPIEAARVLGDAKLHLPRPRQGHQHRPAQHEDQRHA